MRLFNLSLRDSGAEVFCTKTYNQSAVIEISENLIKLWKATHNSNDVCVVMRSYNITGFTVMVNDLEFAHCPSKEYASNIVYHLEREALDGINIFIKERCSFIKQTTIF